VTWFVIDMYYTDGKHQWRGDFMPVVYIDVVWFVNLCMDAAILWSTGYISKRPVRLTRVFLGGLVGSLYSLALFFPQVSVLTTWPGKAIVSLLMMWVVYRPRTWLDLARLTSLFYFVTFVFAGATLALHFAVPGVSVGRGLVLATGHFAYATSIEGLGLVVAVPCSVALTQSAMRRIGRLRMERNLLYTLEVELEGRAVTFVGLADTGNQLRDPLSKHPVCLVDAAVLAPLLPTALQQAIVEGRDVLTALSQLQDDVDTRRFSVVPFQGAGGATQVAVVVKPDKVWVLRNKQRFQTSICLLALHVRPLSAEKKFQAILHIDVIAEVDELHDAKTDSTNESQSQTTHTPATHLDSHSG